MEQCPASIVGALSEIAVCGENFDAVLILRGGGGMLDLACFDDYSLAVAISECPLPVLTAIGHDQDFHVCDMVANRFVKTPTALAAETGMTESDEYLVTYKDGSSEVIGKDAFNALTLGGDTAVLSIEAI